MNIQLEKAVEEAVKSFGIKIRRQTPPGYSLKESELDKIRLYHRNFDPESMLSRIEDHMQPQVIVHLQTPIGLQYALFQLQEDGIRFIIGPWSGNEMDWDLKNRLKEAYPQDFYDMLVTFYENTPRRSPQILATLQALLQLEDETHPVTVRELHYDAFEEGDIYDIHCKEITRKVRTDMAEERYQTEQALISAVTYGNAGEALQLLDPLRSRGSDKSASSVSQMRRDLHRFNTLFSNGVAQASVHPGYVSTLYDRFEDEIDQNVKGHRAAMEVLESMIREYCTIVRTHSLKQYSPIIQSAINYINMHLEQHLSLNVVAKQCHISSSYLSSIFRKETGITLTEYIAQQRISMAQNKLRYNNDSISMIASSVGYTDINYFTRSFKKTTGMTPSSYRETYRVK